MNEQTKELIAIGASVAAHCQPCLSYHVARAKELGLEECAIREAIAVGHRVEKGAMVAMRQFVSEGLDAPVTVEPPSCCKGGKSRGKGCGA